jgi:3-oxoadipate enol-lactonase
MSDSHPCEHACALEAPCADRAQCVASGGLISLDEALRRFEHEAVPGVCDTGRYRCAYYSWGEGPPLLFVPGMSDCGVSFVQPISRLAGQFRCIAYDMPSGRGDGARLERYTHADLVADAFALLDHLGVRQSYFFGASFGSTITLAAMRAQPERIPRAMLQGGFAHRPVALAQRLLAGMACWWPGSIRLLPGRVAVMRHGHHAPFAGRPPEMWSYFLEHTGRPPIRAVARHALLLHQVDLRPVLGEVRQPVLLITGDRDPLVGKECTETLLRGLPNARHAEVVGCGHFPFFTHPEVLAELVREFLTPPRPAEARPTSQAGTA